MWSPLRSAEFLGQESQQDFRLQMATMYPLLKAYVGDNSCKKSGSCGKTNLYTRGFMMMLGVQI